MKVNRMFTHLRKHKRLNTFEEKPKIQKLFDNYQFREQLQSSLPTSLFQVINKEVLDFVQHSKHYRNYCSLQPTPKLIFYNRIGKTGSSSLLTWMYQIKHETNSFEQINYEEEFCFSILQAIFYSKANYDRKTYTLCKFQ